MALKLELPIAILRPALEQALSLRERNARAATNPIIKGALEEEGRAITKALETVTELPPESRPSAKQ